MTDKPTCPGRRRSIRLAAAGVAAAALHPGLLVRLARAQERVSEDDELAQQLGYVHDATEVDASEWPTYEEGNICANCELYDGQEGEEWGPCEIFGGDLVNADGWCQAWVPEEA